MYSIEFCNQLTHRGTLVHIFPETDVWHAYTLPGSGLTTISNCLDGEFECEIFRCDTLPESDFSCKEGSAPVGDCVDYTFEWCFEDSVFTMPIVQEIELVNSGPCM